MELSSRGGKAGHAALGTPQTEIPRQWSALLLVTAWCPPSPGTCLPGKMRFQRTCQSSSTHIWPGNESLRALGLGLHQNPDGRASSCQQQDSWTLGPEIHRQPDPPHFLLLPAS